MTGVKTAITVVARDNEMCLLSDSLDENERKETERALTGVVHHGVRPLAVSQWRSLLESEGFEVQSVGMSSMSLLEPRRLISDEGFAGALRFAWNLLRDSEARQRVLEMRSVFRRYRKVLGAAALVATKGSGVQVRKREFSEDGGKNKL